MANAQLALAVRHLRKLARPQAAKDLPDRQLLEEFCSRHDGAAFAAIVERYGRLVLSVCRRVLHHEQDAEDVFQATFLVLARKAGDIRKGEALPSWLHGVAHYLAMKAKRGIIRRRNHERQAPAMSHQKPDLDLRELQAILDEELQRLPENYRAPFVLCCLDGQSKAEAARQLGWKEGTVSGRLARARRRLQQQLVRRGVTLAAVLGAVALTSSPSTAGVPGLLRAATVKAALAHAAGQAVPAGMVSAGADVLLRGVTSGMFVTKSKLTSLLLLAAVVAAVGVGAIGRYALAQRHIQVPAAKSADADPPIGIAEKEKQTRTDRYGDPLPLGALARMGTVRLRHAGHAFSVAFLPDGKSFVSGGYDNKVFLWDVRTAQRLREFTAKDNAGGIDAVAVSPDGKMLASGGGDGIVRLWNLSTAKEVVGCKGHLKRIHGVAFSPDGKLLASGSEDGTIRLWDVSTGKQVRSWKAHPEWGVRTVIFSQNGQTLASIGGSESIIELWETATGRHLRQLGESGGGTCALCFSLDGKTLIASPNGFKPICVWETATGRLLRQFGKTDAAIWSLSVSADGKILAGGGSDGNCRLWDLGTGELIRQFHGNGEDLHSVALSPDGQLLAAASRNHAIYLWDVATGRELHLFSSHRFFLTSAVFTPDGKGLLTGGFDRTIRLWDSATGKEICQYPQVGDYVASLDVSPDGSTLAAGTCRPSRLIGNKPDKLAVRLWDVATGKELRPLGEHAGPYLGVAFSPDGKLLAVKDGGGVLRLWDLVGRMERWRLEGLVDLNHYGVAFSPDGKSVACPKDDNMICLWNATTGKVVREFRAPQQEVRSLVFSPDGKTLFAGGYTQPIRLWEVASGKERLHLEGSPVHVTVIALSPDGRTLASASYTNSIRLWDTATGQKLAEFDMPSAEALAFSSDGQRLASGGSDGTALVWDVASITTRERPLSKPLSPKQFDPLWMDLTAQDAGRAYQAISTLVMSQDRSVSLLKKHLAPVPAVDKKELARLIADLDSNQFMVREKAKTELESLGELAVPACRQALQSSTSAEVRRRLEAVLECETRRMSNPPPELLQILRVLEVLEHIGTPEARQVLQSLAKGASEARLTQEARFSLDRLQMGATKKP